MGDDAKVIVAHHFHRALVLCQGLVKGDCFLTESFLLAAPDQFLQDLRRCDGVAVVAGNRFLQSLREGASLQDVDLVLFTTLFRETVRFYFQGISVKNGPRWPSLAAGLPTSRAYPPELRPTIPASVPTALDSEPCPVVPVSVAAVSG